MNGPKSTILSVECLCAGYGSRPVLHGIDLNLAPGEALAVIGHNGAGKSTLLKAIFGTVRMSSGRIRFEGKIVDDPQPHWWLTRGVAYVPQGGRVFDDLTVRENLHTASLILPSRSARRAAVERALDDTPFLRARRAQRARTLSGGERQALSFAMALVVSPRLILMDEPSLGLAPVHVKVALSRVNQLRAERGMSVIIVEQKVRQALELVDRVMVMRVGRVSWTGCAAELIQDEAKLRSVFL